MDSECNLKIHPNNSHSENIESRKCINSETSPTASLANENEVIEITEISLSRANGSLNAENSDRLQAESDEKVHSVRISASRDTDETENSKNKIKTRSKKRYFCCGSLADGAVASTNYTTVISVLIILGSCHVFFRSSGDEEGTTKTLSFCAILYAICYIRSGTNLKRAIDEEQRDRLLPWIIFSIITIFFMMSGAIYVSVTYWDELDDFYEDLTMPCLLIVMIATLHFLGFTLMYCTWGVIMLFRSMGDEQSSEHSLMHDLRVFIYGVSV
ncbi:uncharacterized protein CDAR_459921 [Caerostris darwini]|uniref:Uncharacterized protein n=1 Tax=Caerostris darwini TaxID=1538125 RepID=A0AAV4QJQ5_9ARAC|nr:uncharacterized protein CDAR_459921 [Caerostris darwini]